MVKEEKYQLVKENKEMRKVCQEMDIIKKTDERLRLENHKLQKDFTELAILKEEEKEEALAQIKFIVNEKRKLENCIEQFEEKMKLIEEQSIEKDKRLDMEIGKSDELVQKLNEVYIYIYIYVYIYKYIYYIYPKPDRKKRICVDLYMI